jgi:hypothetical protein
MIIRADADRLHFPPHGENFFSSLVAVGLLKAKQCPERLHDLRIWWREQEEPDGHFGEVIGIPFTLQVFAGLKNCPSCPDLRLESDKALILIEAKLQGPIEETQWKVFEYLAQHPTEKPKIYLLMAIPSFGQTRVNPGQLPEFYRCGLQLSARGVKSGFVELPHAVNWACDLLQLNCLQ